MKSFKDNWDGYYEFADDAPPEWYAHLIPCAPKSPKPLVERQAERWELIKKYRDDLRFNGGVKVGTNWFQSTQLATGEYTALHALYNALPDSTVLRADWRTMNGTLIDMTPLLVRQILAAGVAQVMLIDDASQSHKTAMEASATPETYDFSAGWPAIYVPL